MSETFRRIVALVHRGEVRISAHDYDEIAEDGILAGEVIDGVGAAVVVEEYLPIPKDRVCSPSPSSGIEEGAQFTQSGVSPIGQTSQAVLVTAYRPDPARRTEDVLRRRQ